MTGSFEGSINNIEKISLFAKYYKITAIKKQYFETQNNIILIKWGDSLKN